MTEYTVRVMTPGVGTTKYTIHADGFECNPSNYEFFRYQRSIVDDSVLSIDSIAFFPKRYTIITLENEFALMTKPDGNN